MRRLDMEQYMGRVPVPEVRAGMHLVDLLFKQGPIRGELPLCEADLEPWERRRGVDLAPWQAELVVEMSKAYMSEMHAAKEHTALAPWPKARAMWKYVTEKKHEQSRQENANKEARNGDSKRRRNPAPR